MIAIPSPEYWSKKPLIGGYDPGKKGAFVTLDAETGKIDGIMRVPLLKAKKGTTKREIDYDAATDEWGSQIQLCRCIFIEHLWGAAPRGQGRRDSGPSQFKLGYVAGFFFGCVKTWGAPYRFITPQSWHKALEYPQERGKEPSFGLARSLFPDSVKEFARVTVDEGVCEAALIAKVGRDILQSSSEKGPK